MGIALYGLIAFAVIFSGAIVGLILNRLLPEHYRQDATRRIVQTSMGMVSLLSALVLGLLVATAKNKFDTTNKQVEEFAANLMWLDRELTNYGEDGKAIRPILKQFALTKFRANWPQNAEARPGADALPPSRLFENLQQKIRALTPQTDAQRSTLASALEITNDLNKTSWLQRAQESGHVPRPFIFVLVAWLCLLFVSFGLFAPTNALALIALFICAASLSGAITLVADMDRPFEGFIAISPQPMEQALAIINAP